ncbi:MAG: hypothetical protein IID16_01015 [Candidatus Marinimicrobia bacterium]|nr:hypothetical protein [Candidatus Neomarinimicrobiota bacterium]
MDSELQDTRIDLKYLKAWAERDLQTNLYFLNWVKTIFKTENFLTFFKYLRYPLPSAKLVKNSIEPQLRRVFMAEDADFKYDVSGAEEADFMPDLKIKEFNKEIFEKLLYKHNSILIEDLDPTEPNKPFRYFLDIKDVVSIQPGNNGIDKIAFKATVIIDQKIVRGTLFIDSSVYQFYDEDHKLLEEKPHDLGSTPAHFISPNKLKGNFVVRESIYTYIRQPLEELVFLTTLQRMQELNGAIPVVAMVDTEEKKEEGIKGSELQPDADKIMGGQQAKVFSQNSGQGTGDLQPGTIHKINPDDIRDDAGRLNMDVVKNWITFLFIPIEALEYLSKRIIEIEKSIKITIIGDVVSGDESSKNELQIEKSISVLENNLTSLSETLNRIRWKSDSDMLKLKYGPGRVNEVFIHYGTDFFLDSQTKLFEDLEKAPNSLERKTIIVRINQNRYKNNIEKSARQRILYDLLPYCSDSDFEIARATGTAGDLNIQYQLRFNYWISIFETQFGDIVTFWKELGVDNSQKTKQINDLIVIIINENTKDDERPREISNVSIAN